MTSKAKLSEAMRLARQGDLQAGMAMLDQALSEARKAVLGGTEVILLARNAALLSSKSGDTKRAIEYYKEAIALDPVDAYTHWALGDAYSIVGDKDLSNKHFLLFEEIAKNSHDPDLVDLYAAYVVRKTQNSGDESDPARG